MDIFVLIIIQKPLFSYQEYKILRKGKTGNKP